MEVAIQRGELFNHLQRLQGVVEKKNTIPILSNTLLTAGPKGSLELVATDLEVGIRTLAEARVTKPGSITVPSRKMFEIVRLLPEAEVRIKADENHRVEISCSRSRFRIVGLPKDDFPPFTDHDFSSAIGLDLPMLRAMIAKVLFATTAEETRYSLQGTLMILGPDGLTLVATDGHRLAKVTGKVVKGSLGKEIKVIVPRKALAEISRIDWQDSGEARLGIAGNRVFLQSGGTTLVSNTVEGTFPAYDKVIPKDNDKILELGTQEFSDVVRRVALVSNERSRAVKISLQSGRIEVSSSNPETGEARENVEVGYSGSDLEIGFNARYLLDFLGAVGQEKITLHLKDEQTQGMMAPAGSSEPEYRYVVMPMRI